MPLFAAILDTPAGYENLQNLSISPIITWAISVILVVAVVAFFFMFVFGGIRWMLSFGKEEKIDAAKRQLKNAGIGLLIVFLSFAGIRFLEQTLGISLLNLELPSSI